MHTILNILRSNREIARQQRATDTLRAGDYPLGRYGTHAGADAPVWTRLPGSVRF